MGLERLVLMKGDDRVLPPRPDLFFAALGEDAVRLAFVLMSALQKRGIRAETDFEGKSLKAQMRRAGKLQARRVLILGGDELARGVAQLRDMDAATQEEVSLERLEERLARMAIEPETGIGS
jgi:histidyl-tRNA synthetase